MFTGLIEATGTLARVDRRGPEARLVIEVALDHYELGESIAVNGVCLTVVRFDAGGFEADASAETLARTTLGALPRGARVNLERAVKLGDRMGGHVVAGHVDGVGEIASVDPVGKAWKVAVKAPAALGRFLAEKGSITVDGISLTINRIAAEPATFELMIVPHTLAATTLEHARAGDAVNLEVDLLARYVARQLSFSEPSADARLMDKLREGGFL